MPVTGTVVYSRPLGYGWTHNYDVRLTFPTDPGGEAGTVILKAAAGSRMRFNEVSTGTYQAFPGVWANLTRSGATTSTYVYTATAANQETYVFTSTGRLTKYLDPQGNQTNFTYSSGITLTRVTDAVSGRYLDFSYDGQGRLATVTDHTSRTVTYGYDANNNLITVRDTRGLTWTYSYTTAGGGAGTPHYLHTITDPDGKVVEKTTFDSQGRAILQEDGLGNDLAQISYVGGTRVVTETGVVITDTYDVRNLLTGQVDAQNKTLTYTFDSAFNRTSLTDANGNPPTQYARTPFGLTTALTDAMGFTTTFSYDGRNNLTRTVDARGIATNYTYDSQNNLKTVTTISGTISYTYNSAGQVIEMRDERNNPTFYGYNPTVGNRTVITDALGNTTRYDYDNLGRVVTTTDALNKKTVNSYDAADHLIKVTENYLAGQPQNHQNTYNLITQDAYDGAGRQTVITDTLGRVTVNEYDNAGRLFRTIENKHPSITTQNYQNTYNLWTTYGYDSFGRQISVTDTLGRVTRTEYDTLGRVKRVIENYVDGSHTGAIPDEDIITTYGYDANGNLTSEKHTPGSETRTSYDTLNRATQVIAGYEDGVPESRTDQDAITTYTYDAVGNQTSVTDPLGRETRSGYDGLNRVITMTLNYVDGIYNPANPDRDLVTTYRYDATSNQTQIIDPKSQITTFQYDALNRVVTTTNALNGLTIVAYDAVGNQTRLTNPKGQIYTSTYDSLYRLTQTQNPKAEIQSYTYDALSNQLTATDPESRTTRSEYDSLNRLITTTLNYVSGGPVNASTNVKTVYTYDALSNKHSENDALSHTTVYTYDDLNRVLQISKPQALITYTYDGQGNLQTFTNGANETTEYDYDAIDRLKIVRNALVHLGVNSSRV